VGGSMSLDTAWAEARALYRMVGKEHTVDEVRELIAVPASTDMDAAVPKIIPARVHPAPGSMKLNTLETRLSLGMELSFETFFMLLLLK